MSSSFAGASTRGMSDLEREIEYRLGRMSAADALIEVNASVPVKGVGPYSKAHDDFSTADDNSRNHDPKLHPMAGDREQEEMDRLDNVEYLAQARIKKQRDQFPGAKMNTSDMSGDKFSDEVEKRMQKRLAGPFYGKCLGVEFTVKKEGGGYYWKVGPHKSGQNFQSENEAVNAAEAYIRANR